MVRETLDLKKADNIHGADYFEIQKESPFFIFFCYTNGNRFIIASTKTGLTSIGHLHRDLGEKGVVNDFFGIHVSSMFKFLDNCKSGICLNYEHKSRTSDGIYNEETVPFYSQRHWVKDDIELWVYIREPYDRLLSGISYLVLHDLYAKGELPPDYINEERVDAKICSEDLEIKLIEECIEEAITKSFSNKDIHVNMVYHTYLLQLIDYISVGFENTHRNFNILDISKYNKDKYFSNLIEGSLAHRLINKSPFKNYVDSYLGRRGLPWYIKDYLAIEKQAYNQILLRYKDRLRFI